MADPQELVDQILQFQAQSDKYGPRDILEGIRKSGAFPDVMQQVDQYRKSGRWTDQQILDGIVMSVPKKNIFQKIDKKVRANADMFSVPMQTESDAANFFQNTVPVSQKPQEERAVAKPPVATPKGQATIDISKMPPDQRKAVQQWMRDLQVTDKTGELMRQSASIIPGEDYEQVTGIPGADIASPDTLQRESTALGKGVVGATAGLGTFIGGGVKAAGVLGIELAKGKPFWDAMFTASGSYEEFNQRIPDALLDTEYEREVYNNIGTVLSLPMTVPGEILGKISEAMEAPWWAQALSVSVGQGAGAMLGLKLVTSPAQAIAKLASVKLKASQLIKLQEAVEAMPDSPQKSAILAAQARQNGRVTSEQVALEAARPEPIAPNVPKRTPLPIIQKQREEIAEQQKVEAQKTITQKEKPKQKQAKIIEEKPVTIDDLVKGESKANALWYRDFYNAAMVVLREEKHGPMTDQQKQIQKDVGIGKRTWDEFSRSLDADGRPRYTEEEISRFAHYLNLDKVGEALGVPEDYRAEVVKTAREALERETAAKLKEAEAADRAMQQLPPKQVEVKQEAPKATKKRKIVEPKTEEPKPSEPDAKTVLTNEKEQILQQTARDAKKAGKGATPIDTVKQKAIETSVRDVKTYDYSPEASLFTHPELAHNTTRSWRSMGWKEAFELVKGKLLYTGDKQGQKGNFHAGIPESAGQYGGKDKFLVEFRDVQIDGGEGLRPGTTAGKENIAKLWVYNTKTGKWDPVSMGETIERLTALKNAEYLSGKTPAKRADVLEVSKVSAKDAAKLEKEKTELRDQIMKMKLGWKREALDKMDRAEDLRKIMNGRIVPSSRPTADNAPAKTAEVKAEAPVEPAAKPARKGKLSAAAQEEVLMERYGISKQEAKHLLTGLDKTKEPHIGSEEAFKAFLDGLEAEAKDVSGRGAEPVVEEPKVAAQPKVTIPDSSKIAAEIINKKAKANPKEAKLAEEIVDLINNGDTALAKVRGKKVPWLKELTDKLVVKAKEERGSIPVLPDGRSIWGALKRINEIMGEEGMVTFHGTKARFTKLMDEFIGSGEGAQVYGYGHYLTTKWQIAKWYADKMGRSSKEYVMKVGGEEVDLSGFKAQAFAAFLKSVERFKKNPSESSEAGLIKDLELALENLKLRASKYERRMDQAKRTSSIDEQTLVQRLQWKNDAAIRRASTLLSQISKTKDIEVISKSNKFIHEFDLPEDVKWFDLDTNLSKEHSALLLDALQKYTVPKAKGGREIGGWLDPMQVREMRKNELIDRIRTKDPIPEDRIQNIFNKMLEDYNASGPENWNFLSNLAAKYGVKEAMRMELSKADLYLPDAEFEAVIRKYGMSKDEYASLTDSSVTGMNVMQWLEEIMGEKEASQFLKRTLGVEGNTYLGRTSGERNYVVFDPSKVQHVKTHTLDMLGFQSIYERLVEFAKESPTIERLTELGKAIYLKGADTFSQFVAEMSKVLGATWDSAKELVSTAWDAVKWFNDELGQRGAVGDLSEPPPRKSSITVLTESLDNGQTETLAQTTARMARESNVDARRTLQESRDTLSQWNQARKDSWASLVQRLGNPEPYSTFQEAINKYTGSVQRGAGEARLFSKSVLKNIPDKGTREAITCYVQAGGDVGLLQTRLAKIKANTQVMQDTVKFLSEKLSQTGDKEVKKALDSAISRQKNFESIKDDLVKQYEKAIELGPYERSVAEKFREYYDQKFQEGLELQLLEQGYENYVNQIWKDQSRVNKGVANTILGAVFTDPGFVKKRIHASYFDGEILGLMPKSKDIGFLLSTYDTSFTEAVAARNLIATLQTGMATDGRPLLAPFGAGQVTRIVEKGEGAKTRFHVETKDQRYIKVKDQNGHIINEFVASDYTPINHPALRKWEWVEHVADGQTVYVRGQMAAHPEIMQGTWDPQAGRFAPFQSRDNLRAVLEGSRVREAPLARMVLDTSATLKGTLLSLSGFHQVQTGLHAVFHKVKPWDMPKLKWDDPVLIKATDNGLIIADYKGLENFAEGLAAGGLISKTPVIGRFFQAYSEYLFQDYIPRLKFEMWKEAYARNTKRYGSFMKDSEIAALTADQSNAAFGSLNYRKLGRDRTTQDLFRLMFLAPDFLEARARFVGQAFKAQGQGLAGVIKNEQTAALVMRGAGIMFVAARIMNAILGSNDDPVHKPFSVLVGDKEFTLRSVPGDLYHLFSDPRSFLYYRMNPFTIRTTIEELTARDEFARYRDAEDRLGDYLTAWVPILFQKRSEPKGVDWTEKYLPSLEGILRSAGVSVFKARSAFEKKVIEMHSHKIAYTPNKFERDRYKYIKDIGDAMREAYTKGEGDKYRIANEQMSELIRDKKLYPEDREEIFKRSKKDPTSQTLNFLSAEEMFECMKLADHNELVKYKPVWDTKVANLAKKHPTRFRALMGRYYEYYRADDIDKMAIWAREFYQQSALGRTMGHTILSVE